MPCWVVPAVASEIWNVAVEQILSAVRSGQIPCKHENGFTFVDVAPGAAPAHFEAKPRPKPITYKVPRSQTPGDPIPLPRPAEIITPVEMQELHTDAPCDPSDDLSAMGDWRKGRRNASARRVAPGA